MDTKSIIKKYRQTKILKESQDQEVLRVYKTLYEAVDQKILEMEKKVNDTLNSIVKVMRESLAKMNAHVMSLKPIPGEKGEPGQDGKDTTIDYQKIENDIIVKLGDLRGEKGDPGKDAQIDTEGLKRGILSELEGVLEARLTKKDEKTKIEDIEGLSEYLSKINKAIRDGGKIQRKSGGGMGNTQHESKSVSSATSSVVTTYPIAANGYAVWVYYQGQMVARGVGYTVSNDRKTINLLFTPIDGTYVDLIYIR